MSSRSANSMRASWRTALALVLALAATAAQAQERVPAKLTLLLMLRVVTYDRNLDGRSSGDFVVLVAHEPAQESARIDLMTAAGELRDHRISGRALRFVQVDLRNPALLREAVQKNGASAVLVLPGASGALVDAVANAGQTEKVYTFSLDPALVERSLGLGVANKAGKPQIVVNLGAARRMDAAYEPAVLRLARVVP